MKDDEWLSREEQVAQEIHQLHRHGPGYDIVNSPTVAANLREGMVWQDGERPRVIIGVRTAKNTSGSVVLIETANRTSEVPADSHIKIWCMKEHSQLDENPNGKPFIMVLPPEGFSAGIPPIPSGGTTPPAHDAAGIVPVWMGPKRIN